MRLLSPELISLKALEGCATSLKFFFHSYLMASAGRSPFQRALPVDTALIESFPRAEPNPDET